LTTNERTKRDVESLNADQIGKVFAVLSHGLLRCLVCGEIFTRKTAREHADVNCYPLLELCLIESPKGENDVT